MLFFYLVLLIIGLIFGSFMTSFTYRITKGEFLPKGRSYCPKCSKQIAWFDNIPLLSYLFLLGKCRNCKKHISVRYPLIEITFSLLTSLIGYSIFTCTGSQSPICGYSSLGITPSLGVMFIVAFVLIAIFIIDLEHQIIPDMLSLFLFAFSFLIVLFGKGDAFWVHMLSGFLASLFLLILHLGTKGKGMGLGDVKLALSIGFLLGWPYTITWLFISFILGAVVGISLLAAKRAQFGMHVPFGPFLITSLFMVLFWGDIITGWLMPYL